MIGVVRGWKGNEVGFSVAVDILEKAADKFGDASVVVVVEPEGLVGVDGATG